MVTGWTSEHEGMNDAYTALFLAAGGRLPGRMLADWCERKFGRRPDALTVQQARQARRCFNAWRFGAYGAGA